MSRSTAATFALLALLTGPSGACGGGDGSGSAVPMDVTDAVSLGDVATEDSDNADSASPGTDVATDDATPDATPDTIEADSVAAEDTAAACVASACPAPSAPCLTAVCGASGRCAEEVAVDGAACDDGDPETILDSCTAGVCAGTVPACTAPSDCDDGDPCTIADCVGLQCIVTNAEAGVKCSAPGVCNAASECDGAGACVAGAAVSCVGLDDGCHVGQCDVSAGGCAAVPRADGVGCDDGDAATVGDRCTAGVCAGITPSCTGPADCADGDPCTEDECVDWVCAHRAALAGTVCDDGSACTVDDVCDGAGSCVPGAERDCAGFASSCHIGACSADAGGCISVALGDGVACNDHQALTAGETCSAGVCGGGATLGCVTSADCASFGDGCNQGVCDQTSHTCHAEPVADGSSCDDGDPCTLSDTCGGGVCVAGAPKSCAALDAACVVGVCAATTGACVTKPRVNGTACSSGAYCQVAEACVGGACTGGHVRDCSGLDAACAVGSCDEGQDACVASPRPSGTACTTGDLCLLGQACDDAGACGGGAPPDCSAAASDSCHQGACDPSTGGCVSVAKQAGATCSDGSGCTLGDTCDASAVCQPGATKPCDDLIGCTADACVPASGACTHTPDDAVCADTDWCNGVEVCDVAAGCVAGTPPCDPAGGCDATLQQCIAPDEIAFQAALALYNALDYSGAIAAFDAFLAGYPTSIRADNAYYLIARSHFELLEFAVARDMFAQFPTLYPTSSLVDDGLYYLGRSDYELLAYVLAAAELEQLLVDWPLSPYLDNAQYYLGRSYYELMSWSQATAALDLVIANVASSYRDAALLWAGRAAYEWARGDAVQPSPHFAEADVYFALYLADFGGTGNVYEDNVRYYYGLSAYHFGDYVVAATRFDAVRTLFPASVYLDNAWYYLGMSYYKQPDYATAAVEFDAFLASPAIPVTSSYADNVRYFGGRAYHRMADAGVNTVANYGRATTLYTELFTSYPTSAYADNAYYQLIRVKVKQLLCTEAQALLGQFQAAYPLSTYLPTATSLVQGC